MLHYRHYKQDVSIDTPQYQEKTLAKYINKQIITPNFKYVSKWEDYPSKIEKQAEDTNR